MWYLQRKRKERNRNRERERERETDTETGHGFYCNGNKSKTNTTTESTQPTSVYRPLFLERTCIVTMFILWNFIKPFELNYYKPFIWVVYNVYLG